MLKADRSFLTSAIGQTTYIGETMLAIACILVGLVLGQHIKISTSPELSAFFRSAWALIALKAPEIRESAIKIITEAQTQATKPRARKPSKVEGQAQAAPQVSIALMGAIGGSISLIAWQLGSAIGGGFTS
jgi:hypothetical protein